MSESLRFDRSVAPRVRKTGEGYLRGEAIVTRVGVFEYNNADGTIRRELRHPDEVFAKESLDSIKMIPVTVEHPNVLVNSTNTSSFAVGTTGENYRVEGGNIIVPLTITSDRGITAVEDGLEELSLGYTQTLVEEAGTFRGEAYTHRQTNIRYNHLSLVKRARAGSEARLNLDGVSVDSIKERPMAQQNVNGINYDAAPEVVNHVASLSAEISRLTTDAAGHQKALDTLQARLDVAEEEKKKAEKERDEEKAKNTDSAIDARVTERLALRDNARRLSPSLNTDGMSTRAIQEAAIKAVSKSVNFDGKSDDYVAARFDAEVERILASPVNIAAGGVRGYVSNNDGVATPSATQDAAAVAEAAYQKNVAGLNDWRNKA